MLDPSLCLLGHRHLSGSADLHSLVRLNIYTLHVKRALCIEAASKLYSQGDPLARSWENLPPPDDSQDDQSIQTTLEQNHDIGNLPLVYVHGVSLFRNTTSWFSPNLSRCNTAVSNEACLTFEGVFLVEIFRSCQSEAFAGEKSVANVAHHILVQVISSYAINTPM